MPWMKLGDNIIPEFHVNQRCGISIIEVRTGTVIIRKKSPFIHNSP